MKNIPEEKRRWLRRRTLQKSGIFIALLVVNSSILVMLGTLIIYHISVAPVDSPMTFVKVKAIPPPPKPPKQGGEGQKSLLDPSAQIVPPISATPEVITTSASKFDFKIPGVTVQTVPTIQSLLTPSGAGSASGSSGGGVPQASPFGNSVEDSSNSNGLVGNLYDFTRDATNRPIHVARLDYWHILPRFIDNSWQPNNPCYTSPNKLCINHIFYPLIRDENAGTAFGSPDSSRAFWVVHYQGAVSVVSLPLNGGRCRFLGFGDNVLFVAVNGKVVLDASDQQYLQRKGENKKIGEIVFPRQEGKPPTPGGSRPLFCGDWMNLEQGTSYKIDILVGDEGGVTTAGLFLETDQGGESLTKFASNGAPKVPLFSIGDIADSDQKMLSKWLPPECFQQTIAFKSECLQ